MERSKLVATIVVLLISSMAFIAGSLQENYATMALNEKEEVQDLQDDLERMEDHAYYIMGRDVTRIRECLDLLSEITLLDAEFELLNVSLSIQERQVYVRRTIDMLIQMQGYQNNLLILHLYRHFNQSSDTYYIAHENNEGYNFSITMQMWQAFETEVGSPVTIMTPEQRYGNYFSYDAIQTLPEGFRPHDPETGEEIFIVESAGVEFFCEYFLLSQVQSLQSQINLKLDMVSSLESITDRISSSVGLITVAMLLATVMSNRADKRKLEKEIVALRADLGKETKLDKDNLTMSILLIALFLAILGIYLALF
ncbi:MAG: hypothetical protein ACXACG_16755 [Candidatus Thorarchaeota archaeon]|jgi:hypothetical protein